MSNIIDDYDYVPSKEYDYEETLDIETEYNTAAKWIDDFGLL